MIISNGSEFVKVTKNSKKLDFSNIVSSRAKSLEIFADESEGNDGLKMKKTRVPVIENGKDDYKKKEKMDIEVDSDSALEGYWFFFWFFGCWQLFFRYCIGFVGGSGVWFFSWCVGVV
jgi:hypothetical protein